jgi:hypothetical protein
MLYKNIEVIISKDVNSLKRYLQPLINADLI